MESDKGKSSDLGLVGYWLKVRLMQTVLEVYLIRTLHFEFILYMCVRSHSVE